jgi:ABC-type lipoprotein release transport system permease subunit
MATIMSRKKLIMLEMVVGSIAGGYLPALFGIDGLMVSLLGGFIGGIIGIWICYNSSSTVAKK